jgi:Ala-tRNA(Pro) deacylase
MSLSRVLEGYLADRDATYTIEMHSASTTSVDTARLARIDEDSLAKSVLLKDERGFVLAVLPASRRLEFDRIERKLGRRLQLSSEREIIDLFPDCALGAVPPLGAAYGLPTVIDSSLEGRSEVFFEAGDHESLIRMDGDEFFGLLATASVAEIAADRACLNAALARRELLGRSLSALRKAADAPIGGAAIWRSRLKGALRRLVVAADDHIGETEAPGGLLAEVEEKAPRLWREVDRMRDQHVTLLSDCFRMLKEVNGKTASCQLMRHDALRLAEQFEVHRHAAADLVYESFGIDIGGG